MKNHKIIKSIIIEMETGELVKLSRFQFTRYTLTQEEGHFRHFEITSSFLKMENFDFNKKKRRVIK